jgi:hypothetical protein
VGEGIRERGLNLRGEKIKIRYPVACCGEVHYLSVIKKSLEVAASNVALQD